MPLHKGIPNQASLAGGGPGAALSLLTAAWYVLGAIVVGALLAKWSWILLKAPATVIATVPAHTVSEDAGRLFGVAPQGPQAVASTAAFPDLKLIGVFAPDTERPGFAVFKTDAQHQVGVVAGATVAPGVKLLEVHADHVVLESGGVRHNLEMVNINVGVNGTGILPVKK